jgi:hypothetical protein
MAHYTGLTLLIKTDLILSMPVLSLAEPKVTATIEVGMTVKPKGGGKATQAMVLYINHANKKMDIIGLATFSARQNNKNPDGYEIVKPVSHHTIL